MPARQRRITYANVVATLALFIAVGGSSYAALKITGKQVKDNSLTTRDIRNHSLLAKDFKKKQLPRGAKGAKGDKGDPGAAGRSALTPLQAGESESGVFAIGGAAAASGEFFITSVTFPIPLAHSLTATHVVVSTGASTAHCPGSGQADAGFLCLYVSERSTEMNAPTSGDIKDPAQSPNSGADRRGFYLIASSNAATTFAGINGTWTYRE